ncbi:MAG: hypothetical protein CMH31_02420 [Micavibrio sp.]|nr:hypothetical protein [Micavibrio sp.]|tara:strand:+ start:40 stop:249 length:210 start_codon:yes stop_codon:yes gene_type:complete
MAVLSNVLAGAVMQVASLAAGNAADAANPAVEALAMPAYSNEISVESTVIPTEAPAYTTAPVISGQSPA